MNKKIVGLVASLLLLMAGCSGDELLQVQQVDNTSGVKTFTSFTATLDDMAGTRAYFDDEAIDGIRQVNWNLSDVIYVYSDTDTELKKYEMTSLSEDNQAVFSGEEVTGNKFYAVYAQNREITVDEDNCSIVHFNRAGVPSTYGFNGPLVATATGNALSFKQVLGIIHVTVGNINQIERVSFSGNKLERIGGKGYVDMAESNPILRLDSDANTISYSQLFDENFDDRYTDIYLCIPPTIFEDGFNMRISGKDSNDNEFVIEKNFDSRFEVKAGTISRFSLVDITAELEAKADEIIEFADENVKAICVQNWDTDGDGELSYAEAAAVTDVPTTSNQYGEKHSVFASQYYIGNKGKAISTFDELQHFTSLTSIPYGMFRGQSLSQVTLPESLTTIGQLAFYNCTYLRNIYIPETVTCLDDSAFNGCIGLTNINIPINLRTIGEYAFYGCGNLKSIVIPESVTSIGNQSFGNCNGLISFICLPANPPTLGSNAFKGMPGTIYVPAASLDAYKTADGWKDYANRILAIPE